jgi:hypothetical protein
VRRFARECNQGIIMKTLSSFAIYERGEQKVVFTNSVQTKDLEHLADLRYCPATFQEHVLKALELRTTIVADRVFTASIDSQRSEKSSIDWRRDGFGLIDEWEPYELPAEVEERLLKLMRFLGLNYGAADFILTPMAITSFWKSTQWASSSGWRIPRIAALRRDRPPACVEPKKWVTQCAWKLPVSAHHQTGACRPETAIRAKRIAGSFPQPQHWR